ncbi:hypothetical protein [Actinoplanes solisilvae]|uniref:hypothetical protein n=1 Tax=Actinoplanes solisilvae TaxID=2486853 RepID=UPI000FD701FF|nr:hypothetical protein [Actinoplanes solisilvae]
MKVLFRLGVAGAALAAGLGVAAPASAAVTYDPKTMKGFAGSGDVRKAFGWTEAQLAAKTPALEFVHGFWLDGNFSVGCGKVTFPATYRLEAGYMQLRHAAVVDSGRAAATGYARKVTGFWITGASMGVSGTAQPPQLGQACPGGRKGKVTKMTKVSQKRGWGLNVVSGNDGRRLAGG